MNKYNIHHLFNYMVVACMVTVSTSSLARMPSNITNDEMSLLPAYCHYTQGFKLSSPFNAPSAGVQRWVSVMGKDFWHMHHHCWALLNFNRAQRALLHKSSRRALLLESYGDFNYVIRNAQDDFILLPEVLVWAGRNALLLNDHKGAEQAFKRARSIKPDYWPAYFHWAHYLNSIGRKVDALELLKQGLEYSPESTTLQKLYKDLGGILADSTSSDKPNNISAK